jgi:hypothetical protein
MAGKAVARISVLERQHSGSERQIEEAGDLDDSPD